MNHGPIPELQVSRLLQGQNGGKFIFGEQDIESRGGSISTLDEFARSVKGQTLPTVPDLVVDSDMDYENDQGSMIRRFDFTGSGGLLKGASINYLQESTLGFNALYTLPAEDYEKWKEMIDYSLSSFRVVEPEESQ